jgi:hypothetical protein
MVVVISGAFHMCKNGEFELEVKTTTTPEITTTMFDGDATDQEDYTLVEQTDDTIGSSNRHLYFLVDEYVNGNGDVVSDSFELKINKIKASVNS